jgi:hypothetical protein
MKKQALVTLAIGAKYQEMFKRWYLPGWRSYCERQELDLVIIDTVLDESPRAKSRSPAWQKCLIHKHPEVARYEQVAWVDADIRIRPTARSLFAEVPVEAIGATNEYATPSREDYDMVIDALYRHWEETGAPYVDNRTPQQYHGNFGLECSFDGVVQTGVIVMSPGRHGWIFEKAYTEHEDKGDASWNYEMRPLSYEIQKAGVIKWLPPKFNMGWSIYEMLMYPFLGGQSSMLQKVMKRLGVKPGGKLRTECVNTAFRNNYFLHFAGGSKDYELIAPDAYVK